MADGTFYGELILRRGDDEGEEVAVDRRPSDGIASAVRHELPVFVDDSLDTVFVAAPTGGDSGVQARWPAAAVPT